MFVGEGATLVAVPFSVGNGAGAIGSCGSAETLGVIEVELMVISPVHPNSRMTIEKQARKISFFMVVCVHLVP